MNKKYRHAEICMNFAPYISPQALPLSAKLLQGLVLKSTGSWYKVRVENQGIWDCRLKGKLKLSKTGVSNPVAVGDHAELEAEPGQKDKGLIVNIRERENYIIRKSVHKTGHAHILAANVDQLVVIASLKLPRTSLGFIDRLLVSAESYHIPAKVIFNKADLLGEDENQFALELAEMYSRIGYESFMTAVPTGQGIERLKDLLRGKISLLAGHSGVGKSSLVNAISPGMKLQTQEISSFANKGKHTTTYAEMHEWEPESFLIDTPGIKELGLMEMENDNLSLYFPEMRPFAARCKFYNCSHTHEPQCAVIQAVEDGLLPIPRYESYLSMVEDEDNRR